jgi:hypothetical protein
VKRRTAKELWTALAFMTCIAVVMALAVYLIQSPGPPGGSMSDSRTSSAHWSALMATEWLQWWSAQ